ncbi:MAG TPA: hypothetical protein VD836_15925 [Solirubrobacteraceae bacterium]|nr:hypothetical protein [Solirubrobacteraceae bacterium]
MRRIAVLLAAALALACVAGAADARPRKKHRKRGHAVVALKRLPGGLKGIEQGALPAPAAPLAPVIPGTPGSPEPEPPPLPPAPPPPTGSGRSVQATTDDADPDALRLALSRTTVLPGTVKVTFNNAWAQDPHNLVLEGPGEPVVFDELPKGEVAARSVPLSAGTWTLYCGLDGHRERGMQATLIVAS